jgi:D-alanyl-D-alanine dipeptidase
MIVPRLERPDAADAPVALADWADGEDPYARLAALLDPAGRYGISDSAWVLHLLELQGREPGASYVSLTKALPMLRAVKDADELARLAAAAAAADATYRTVTDSGARRLNTTSHELATVS